MLWKAIMAFAWFWQRQEAFRIARAQEKRRREEVERQWARWQQAKRVRP
jgi:hypothetical protein